MSNKRKRKAPEPTLGISSTEDSGTTNSATSNSEKQPAKRSNQYSLVVADEEDLIPLVEYYWKLGFNDPDIATHSLDHFDRGQFGLSAKSVQRLRNKLNLKGARQQAATSESITPSTLRYVNGSRIWVHARWSPLYARITQ
ncbi:hypothetical protein B0H13DRAFT_1913518 [Mycena leptocephala]|nr:hypothetical protein B0H13DRAFT_1913518 [Mycena leptocephala]